MKLLFIDLTTGLDSFRDLETRARGGMVASLYILPEVLSQSNKVYVLSDAKQGGKTDGGVIWLTLNDMDWVVKQDWDVLVLNRQTYGEGFNEISAKRRILWVHDMVHGGWIREPRYARMLWATVFMSQYSEETWRAYYTDLPSRSYVIPNGIDKGLFHPQRQKDRNVLLYFSAPNRGLEHLAVITDTARQATGLPLKMVAYSNMATMHPQEGSDKFQKVYENARKDGVILRDPIPQKAIAEEVGKAGLIVKPSDFAETCSNTTIQSLASGTPIITGPTGADKEWIRHKWNGMLTTHTLQDGPLFIMEMCRNLVSVLKDEELYTKLICNAPQTKGLYTWEEIGKKWNTMLTGKS
jgi:glycosyltransferase involved in cell wall biosynthesis